MDDFVLKHLIAYVNDVCSSEDHDTRGEIVRAMWATVDRDPEFWLNAGWTKVREYTLGW